MDRRRGPHLIVLGPLLAGWLSVGLAGGGCRSQTRVDWQADGRIMATWTGASLRADLPIGVTTHGVDVAATRVVELRGYTVRERTSTLDRSELLARSPEGSPWGQIKVESWLLDAGVTVRVAVQPRDELVARDVLERILTRLGL